ncbi:hypothetical protein K1T71_004073 [Dendrolimus kikuchii]|uniref:Uncharacterized protein n=1 Tax=Dendrolimus kikuchii TaxID=765133 RepID=A0ACC1DA76_9NEOP|nr:hypothetical protein K1T71_004073 [Dendrolimus kikuchii]
MASAVTGRQRRRISTYYDLDHNLLVHLLSLISSYRYTRLLEKIKFDNYVCDKSEHNEFKRSEDGCMENCQKGNGLSQRVKRKCIPVTPPNGEIGQGNCLPSTSGTDFDRSHDALNAQLPKLAVQCDGYIQSIRMRNSRSVDTMKWKRKCKIKINYSKEPLNVGEYIIWALRYTDESKCSRNLLAVFEEIAKEVNV